MSLSFDREHSSAGYSENQIGIPESSILKAEGRNKAKRSMVALTKKIETSALLTSNWEDFHGSIVFDYP
jgi:hypothetical protein